MLSTIMSALSSGSSSSIFSSSGSLSSGSISVVTSLGTSMTCSCKNCLYDDIARTCTVSNLLNPARKKTCNVPTTTASTKQPVGLTTPTTTTATTTTTTTTAAASGSTVAGSSCTYDSSTADYPTGCINCTTATYCGSNNMVIEGPCMTEGAMCFQDECQNPRLGFC